MATRYSGARWRAVCAALTHVRPGGKVFKPTSRSCGVLRCRTGEAKTQTQPTYASRGFRSRRVGRQRPHSRLSVGTRRLAPLFVPVFGGAAAVVVVAVWHEVHSPPSLRALAGIFTLLV